MNMQNPLAGVFQAPKANPLTALIDTKSVLVGGIYNLTFNDALIVTNDYDKAQAGGIAKHSFLLAAAVDPKDPGSSPVDDDEVLLLRVREVASLPDQGELVETRLAAMRDASERLTVPYSQQVLDPWTQHQISKSAYRCDILGTFYTDKVGGKAFVEWGSDVDNVYAAARYFVFAPSPDALRLIASYPIQTRDEIEKNDQPSMLPIGVVRYSATRRRSKAQHLDDVPVEVRVSDFVEGRKTAVFGMTRAGKSNSMKTIATAVFEYAASTKTSIGQLIFDPQGEYAQVNQQDSTALRLLGAHVPSEPVRIYKLRPKAAFPEEKPLAINFYREKELPIVWELIGDGLSGNTADYAKNFRSAQILNPDPADYASTGEYQKANDAAMKGRLAFYALLADTGYKEPASFHLRFRMAKDLVDQFKQAHPGNSLTSAGGGGMVAISSPSDAKELMQFICDNIDDPDFSKWKDCEPFNFIRLVFDKSVGTSVRATVTSLRDFHDPKAQSNLTDLVWQDMEDGRISIIDLSVGSEDVTRLLSERLVWGLLDRANKRFRDGKPNVPMQIIVEEAHVLFDRRKGEGKASAEDPWVTLAKQSAKYDMGLVYATQEVSSVDKRILSNTANWLVAHLNSDNETRELSHYYDFGAFADDIRSSEDRGFVRMKTFSGKYIVPVQIAKFDHEMVNKARKTAGFPLVNPDGSLA